MNESRKLADFLVGLQYGDLSNRAIERTKDLLLDQLGVELASSTKPWSIAVYKYIRDSCRPGQSTIFNYGDKVRAEDAAFANATFGHGFEMDDTYLPATTHPGCVVIPSAFALGERELIDGKSFIVAVVSGYEAMCRIGRSVSPSYANRGFHGTSSLGPFAAAVVTGKILDFDGELMLNAISIAGSHSSGLGEFSQTGGNVKRMHAGMAASGGMRAALLAKAGITGPPTVLEGKRGFCCAFSDKYNLDGLETKPGDDFLVNEVSLKRHCTCYQIQAPIEATAKIVKEHGVRPNDIKEIIMGTSRRGLSSVGAILEPKDITSAQFSAPFSLAMCVIKGSNGFRDYIEENLEDPEIKEFARRVRLEVDEEMDTLFPKQATRMTVRLKDGTTYQEKLEDAKGTAVNPMSRDEVKDKFRSLATVVLPEDRVEEIIKVVEDLEGLSDISVLPRMLVR